MLMSKKQQYCAPKVFGSLQNAVWYCILNSSKLLAAISLYVTVEFHKVYRNPEVQYIAVFYEGTAFSLTEWNKYSLL